MIVGSIKENTTLEKRVSLTPESAKNIIGLGLKVCIEKEYALHLGINDNEYKDNGVEELTYVGFIISIEHASQIYLQNALISIVLQDQYKILFESSLRSSSGFSGGSC